MAKRMFQKGSNDSRALAAAATAASYGTPGSAKWNASLAKAPTPATPKPAANIDTKGPGGANGPTWAAVNAERLRQFARTGR